MAKHSYTAGCPCPRCTREASRRDAQSQADPRRSLQQPKTRRRRRRSQDSRRPVPGSQEWAETRGDDLGESPDY